MPRDFAVGCDFQGSEEHLGKLEPLSSWLNERDKQFVSLYVT